MSRRRHHYYQCLIPTMLILVLHYLIIHIWNVTKFYSKNKKNIIQKSKCSAVKLIKDKGVFVISYLYGIPSAFLVLDSHPYLFIFHAFSLTIPKSLCFLFFLRTRKSRRKEKIAFFSNSLSSPSPAKIWFSDPNPRRENQSLRHSSQSSSVPSLFRSSTMNQE